MADRGEGLLLAVGVYQDRAAIVVLFNSYSNRIYGLGLKIARNKQSTRDLIQDMMLANHNPISASADDIWSEDDSESA